MKKNNSGLERITPKKLKPMKTSYSVFFLIANLVLSISFIPEVQAEKTPTDVYYQVFEIDHSLTQRFKLTSTFDKERITNNIKPRNVIQKALSLVDEFRALNIAQIDEARLDDISRFDVFQVTPGQTYQVLELIQEALQAQNAFIAYQKNRISKTPSDVFQLMRQLSWHHLEIAKKKGLVIPWGNPQVTYDANIQHILPMIHAVADEEKVNYKTFSFPKNPLPEIYAHNAYKLQEAVYHNMARYFSVKKAYRPIEFLNIKDLEQITPADVLDLTNIMIGEFKAMMGHKPLDQETASRYSQWKIIRKEILPGDTIQLIQHNFIVSRKIAGSSM